MTLKNTRYADNVPGKYYVERTCIGCMLCAEIAPDNFKFNLTNEDETQGYGYIYKQPTTPIEKSNCNEMMDCCPSNSICIEEAGRDNLKT